MIFQYNGEQFTLTVQGNEISFLDKDSHILFTVHSSKFSKSDPEYKEAVAEACLADYFDRIHVEGKMRKIISGLGGEQEWTIMN